MATDRLEIMRYGLVLVVLGFALLVVGPAGAFLAGLGVPAFWAPLFAFLFAAIVGYFLIFSVPHGFGKK